MKKGWQYKEKIRYYSPAIHCAYAIRLKKGREKIMIESSTDSNTITDITEGVKIGVTLGKVEHELTLSIDNAKALAAQLLDAIAVVEYGRGGGVNNERTRPIW